METDVISCLSPKIDFWKLTLYKARFLKWHSEGLRRRRIQDTVEARGPARLGGGSGIVDLAAWSDATTAAGGGVAAISGGVAAAAGGCTLHGLDEPVMGSAGMS